MQIQWIQEAIRSGRLKITDHADEESQDDHLTYDEIYDSVLHGEIIEVYLEDRPYPSCLIYGNTVQKKPIHSVWAFDQISQLAVLITVYKPDPKKWIHWKERKK